jgi:amino acid transporter
MLESKKISFLSAVLINTNIVIGSAFFVGAPEISLKAGFAAPLTWLLCAALLMPLVLIFSKFAYKYPQAGGIYVYSENELGRFWGYLGAWLYFIGTTAGNAMVLRAFARGLYAFSFIGKPFGQVGISLLMLEVALVLFFAWLSLRNIQLFEQAQILFTGLKIIPFLALAIGACVLFAPTQLMQASVFTTGSLFGAIPAVLFAFLGIEACSAIIDKVDDTRRIGFKVILTSFGVIVGTYAIAQLFIVGMFGQSLSDPFLEVLPRMFGNSGLAVWGSKVISTAILFSFLGGFYGMFYVNSWNLFAMAQQRSIAGYLWWQRLNAQQAPSASIMLQTALLIIMLIVARSGDLLIAMGDLGVLLAYLLTAIAYLRSRPGVLGISGVIAASVLGGFLLQEVHGFGWMVTLPFWAMFIVGLVMYRRKISS